MTKSELEILFKTHYAAMFRLAVSLLYDTDEARDVVSDVFASLLDGGLAIRTDNARGFLLTCVRNGCINVIYSQSTMCWVPVLEPDKRYILLCTRNYGDAQRLFASVVAAPRFGVYRPTLTLSFNKVFFDAEQYGSRLKHHRPLWRFELRNTFVLPHSWTAVLGVRVASDADDEFQSIKHYWTVGACINKSFFNKALLVNIYADDIFRTSKERWTIFGIGTNITKDCYNFDRTIGLTVTYKFNVTRSKYKGTGAGNDEKSRL